MLVENVLGDAEFYFCCWSCWIEDDTDSRSFIAFSFSKGILGLLEKCPGLFPLTCWEFVYFGSLESYRVLGEFATAGGGACTPRMNFNVPEE